MSRSSVHVLLATIPSRRECCERLLQALAQQDRTPDQVELALEGYGNAPSPAIPPSLRVREWRTARLTGPGARWRIASEVPPDTVLVNLDDDIEIDGEPSLVRRLAEQVQRGVTAAAGCGVTASGLYLLMPDEHEQPLQQAHAATFAMAAGDLETLDDMRRHMLTVTGYDFLGDLGHDEALVSACLWRRGVRIRKVPLAGVTMSPVSTAPDAQVKRCENEGRMSRRRQVEALAEIYGWKVPEQLTLLHARSVV